MIPKIRSFLFENKTESQIIAKNTFWLTFGMVVSRSIRAIMIIYAARVLGTDGYGVFSYALSFAALFSVFSDMGLSGILTRQAVQEPKKIKTYVSTTFILKMILIVVTVFITVFLGPYLTNIQEAEQLLIVVSALLAFDSIRGFAFSIARAKNKMEIESGANIITDVLITLLGLLALFVFPSAKFLAYGYTGGLIIGTLITFFILRRDFSGILNNFDKATAKIILRTSWPFALMGLFGGLMINIDTLIIGWFRTAHDLGLYGAAQRPILFLYVFPALFAASIFPIVSRYVAEKKTEMIKKIIEKSISISMMFAFPLLVGGIIVGVPLTLFVFGGAFADASTPFQILLLTLPFVFAGSIIGNILFAQNKQKKFIVAYGLGALANLTLNLILIPPYGVTGSAIATLISQILANGWLWISMQKTIPFSVFPYIKKIIIASIGMGVVCLLISPFSPHVLLTIGTGMVVYLGLLILQKEPLLQKINLKTLVQ